MNELQLISKDASHLGFDKMHPCIIVMLCYTTIKGKVNYLHIFNGKSTPP